MGTCIQVKLQELLASPEHLRGRASKFSTCRTKAFSGAGSLGRPALSSYTHPPSALLSIWVIKG